MNQRQDSPNILKPKVLIIEDDRDLNNLLKFTLEASKEYEVYSHFEGAMALSIIREKNPDLIILDVMLPGMYGTEILKLLRQDENYRLMPVILLTARGQEDDKIEGFESGADDYITKPFSPKELLLRVQALLRRVNPNKQNTQLPKQKIIHVGPISILCDEFKCFVEGAVLALTATEFQLLVYLAERTGSVQSRDSLLQKVWGYEGNMNTRTVDTHIKRLRQKLGQFGFMIETVHGFGYQLNENSTRPQSAEPENSDESESETSP